MPTRDQIETLARDLARGHRDSFESACDNLVERVTRAVLDLVGETPRPSHPEFFMALEAYRDAVRNYTSDADVEKYMDAWELFVVTAGYNPRWPPPRKPAECGPLLQWGEVACRLHGTAVVKDGVPTCVVTGNALGGDDAG